MENPFSSSPIGSVFRYSTSREETEAELNCAFISDEFIRTLSATDSIESSLSSEKAHITGFPENTQPVCDAIATVESMCPETLCNHKLNMQSQKDECHELLPNIIVNFKSYRRFGGRYLPNIENLKTLPWSVAMGNQSLSSPTGSVFRYSTSSEETEDELNCAFISDEFIRTLSTTDSIKSSSLSSEKAHTTGFPENTQPFYDAAATVESMGPESLCFLKLQSQKDECHELLPNINVNFKSYRRFGGCYLPNIENTKTLNNISNLNSNDSEGIETSSYSLVESLTITSNLSLKTSPCINILALKTSENLRQLNSETAFQLLNNSSFYVSGPTSKVTEINGSSTDASMEENFSQISTSGGLNILKPCHSSSKTFQFLNNSSIFNVSRPEPNSKVAEINRASTDASVEDNFRQISISDGLNVLKKRHSSNECFMAENQEIVQSNSTTSKDQSITEADKQNITASIEDCSETSDFTSNEILRRMILLMAPGKAHQIPFRPKRFLTVYNELSTILEDDSACEYETENFLMSNSLHSSSTNKPDSKLHTSRKSFLKDRELFFNNETILRLLEEPGILEESDLTLMSNTEVSRLRLQKDNCSQLPTSVISFLSREESCL